MVLAELFQTMFADSKPSPGLRPSVQALVVAPSPSPRASLLNAEGASKLRHLGMYFTQVRQKPATYVIIHFTTQKRMDGMAFEHVECAKNGAVEVGAIIKV